jgi:hypothetical protein
MFRFPRALLDAEAARKYCHTDTASVIVTDDHVIISLYLDRDPDGDRVVGDGHLGTMVNGIGSVLCLGFIGPPPWPVTCSNGSAAGYRRPAHRGSHADTSGPLSGSSGTRMVGLTCGFTA